MGRLNQIFTVVILITLVCLFLLGCAGLGKRLEPPRIHVSNIRVQEVKGLESILQMDLRVFNTNDIPIVIKGIDCELEINDRRFATGVSNKETKIPSYGTEIIPIVVYSSVWDIFKGMFGLKDLKDKEKLKYRIKGKIRLDAGSLAPSVVHFNSEGGLSLDGLKDSK